MILNRISFNCVSCPLPVAHLGVACHLETSVFQNHGLRCFRMLLRCSRHSVSLAAVQRTANLSCVLQLLYVQMKQCSAAYLIWNRALTFRWSYLSQLSALRNIVKREKLRLDRLLASFNGFYFLFYFYLMRNVFVQTRTVLDVLFSARMATLGAFF